MFWWGALSTAGRTNALTDNEPLSFWTKIILTVVMVVVGPALTVGGVALGTAWFVPDEPTVTVECDDDYAYTKGVDDTFTNDEGDVCVESTHEAWQTATHAWEWWWPLDVVATFIVIIVAAGLAILGMAVLIGGIGSLWEKPKPNRYI